MKIQKQKYTRSLIGLFITLFFCGIVFANTTTTTTTTPREKESVAKASQAWAKALSSGKPQIMVNLYDDNSFLYATFANMLDTKQEITHYFEKLMKHEKLRAEFNNQNIRVYYNHTAINSGLYTFYYQEKGKEVKVPARFTFVYTHAPDDKWVIVEHHSSVLPE